jgi:hypothetical protein
MLWEFKKLNLINHFLTISDKPKNIHKSVGVFFCFLKKELYLCKTINKSLK